ncbi:MAG: molybdopterin molybdotransferase MoeA [Luteolibacter sp.]
MISIEEARRIIRSHVRDTGPVEVFLSEACGVVLAESVFSDSDYPSGDRATMDGYVIRAEEAPGSFRLAGEVPAGAVPTQPLGKGEAIRIFTGALIPHGGGRVIMQEDTRREGNLVHIDHFQENRFIRPQGSEAKTGDIVLPAGTMLGPAEIAILAQVGAVRPRVVRVPVVRHLATGNELVAPDQSPGPGQIRDTNSSLLAALLKAQGIALTDSTRVADDPSALTKIAEGDWDLLLVSGGASVGDYDFGAEALRRLGFTIHFDRVNLRPGKPLTFATRGHQAAFVIPGNPVSHFVCYHVAIRLAVELLAGRSESWNLLTLPIDGGEPVQPDSRETFWPAKISIRDGGLVVAPVRWSTSGDTFSLAGTNALARVNASSPANGLIQTLLLHPL